MINRMLRRAAKKRQEIEVEAAPRELSVIQNEYKEACAALGDREYRLAVLQAESVQLKQRLQQLNQEAAKIEPKAEVASEQT